ncbi:MAG: hypothetical protein JW781_01140 [Deltaproteobacteria bacterium]|nr:hypothetical protein [Candidatus Anaeroferrophillacea bacterium]
MMKKLALFLLAALLLLPGSAAAGDCLGSHKENGVTVTVPDTPPLRIMIDGTVREFTLKQAFAFHGHECPGMTTAFLALRYALNILFGDEIPRADDILIIGRSPAGGIRDLIDLIMKGDNPALKTWAPAGMRNDQSRFTYTIMRKSTAELLEISLKKELLPTDFTLLKQKQKKKESTPEEDRRLHDQMKNMIIGFPAKPATELFGTPEPRKVLLWGSVEKGEMDRHIRAMRMEQKKQLRRQAEEAKK